MDDTLLQISKLDFCIQDVTLFLDTHPDDQEAKKYYKEGMKHLLKMKETYFFILNSSSVSQVFASVFMMTISGSGMN